MKKIRVLITDDSLLFRNVLRNEISKDPQIEVVGLAVDPIDAEKKIKILKPDVITLDVEMPRMNGIDFLKKLMVENPQRVVLVSSLNISVFDALDAGAVDFVKKPDMSRKNELQDFFDEMINKVKIASDAKLKASLVHRQKQRTKIVTKDMASRRRLTEISKQPTISKLPHLRGARKIIAIGASTGGTEATLEVLKKLPADMPGIVVTQHMPAGFTKMYADRLNRICALDVKEAQNGDRLDDGIVLIAPGDFQMRVHKDSKGFYVTCKPGEKVSGHRPSVDVLFESVAETVGKNAIGIILTGMGKDGADNLLKMHKSGAFTIGQDQESCVVYGMPKVAYDMGGVDVQSDVEDIATVILKYLSKK